MSTEPLVGFLAIETRLQLLEVALERLGLAAVDRDRVHDDQRPGLGMGRQRHLEAERTDLLVQRRIEVANASAVRLTTADEDRRAASDVTTGIATLLATV